MSFKETHPEAPRNRMARTHAAIKTLVEPSTLVPKQAFRDVIREMFNTTMRTAYTYMREMEEDGLIQRTNDGVRIV